MTRRTPATGMRKRHEPNRLRMPPRRAQLGGALDAGEMPLEERGWLFVVCCWWNRSALLDDRAAHDHTRRQECPRLDHPHLLGQLDHPLRQLLMRNPQIPRPDLLL